MSPEQRTPGTIATTPITIVPKTYIYKWGTITICDSTNYQLFKRTYRGALIAVSI